MQPNGWVALAIMLMLVPLLLRSHVFDLQYATHTLLQPESNKNPTKENFLF